MAAYVKHLEEQEQEEGLLMETVPPENGGNGHGNGHGHANGKDMAEELQRFLQQRKDRKDED